MPWFRECEIRHGRTAMLAVVGFIATDFVRVPGDMYSFESIPKTIDAHDALLKSGPMYQLLLFIGLWDMVITAPAAVAASKGEREAGGTYKIVSCNTASAIYCNEVHALQNSFFHARTHTHISHFLSFLHHNFTTTTTTTTTTNYSADFGLYYFAPKDPEKLKGRKASEMLNGRLAMCAVGGIATQSMITGHGFPYL